MSYRNIQYLLGLFSDQLFTRNNDKPHGLDVEQILDPKIYTPGRPLDGTKDTRFSLDMYDSLNFSVHKSRYTVMS